MKETIERLFFAIARILFFLVALGGFVILIGTGAYLSKLFYDSFPKKVQTDVYTPEDPNVTFETFRAYAQTQLDARKNRRERIRHYVKERIQNGSSGHDYTIKTMPGNLVSKVDAEAIALYIANDFHGNPPAAFRACAACHGDDAQGKNGTAPSLHSLPILNGVRGRVTTQSTSGSRYAHATKAQRSAFEKFIDRIVLLVNKYASKTHQPGADRQTIVSYVKNATLRYSTDQTRLFWQQLEDGLHHLDHFSQTYRSFSAQSDVTIEPIQWQEYLKWFSSSFAEQVAEDAARQSNIKETNAQRQYAAQTKARHAREKINFYLMVAGGALVVFLLATMLLVLIRIEYNTRIEKHKKEST